VEKRDLYYQRRGKIEKKKIKKTLPLLMARLVNGDGGSTGLVGFVRWEEMEVGCRGGN
jgi:hypothetical protein